MSTGNKGKERRREGEKNRSERRDDTVERV